MIYKLQNPFVLEPDDVGYCMDESGKWFRWKVYPIAKKTLWHGGQSYSNLIKEEDAPKDIPDDYDWQNSWHDKPEKSEEEKCKEAATHAAGGHYTEQPDETQETPPVVHSIEDHGSGNYIINLDDTPPVYDEVNKAKHYNVHPSGIECITVIEHFQYNVGAAIKYLWRAGEKHDDPLMDLEKAEYYIKREIALRSKS